MADYIPVELRTNDGNYRNALRTILKNGHWSKPTKQGPRALTYMVIPMRFSVFNGAPFINERSIKGFWRQGIGELFAFINGATTLSELEEFGCKWWGPWATEEKTAKRGLPVGDIGPGTYGGAFHDFPRPDGTTFDQFKNVVEQLKKHPHDRRHFVSPWIPFYLLRTEESDRKATIAPCHGWVQVRILDDGMHLVMYQRSCDTPVGVPSNMVQYFALGLALEHVLEYRYPFVEYVHILGDAHIYEDQVPYAVKMVRRPLKKLATLTLNEKGQSITDIHDFRADHFDLADYDPHPAIGAIPVRP